MNNIKSFYNYIREDSNQLIMKYIRNEVAWRYWVDYIHAFGSCCGSCDEDSLAEVERSKKELLKNAIELTDHALDF